MDKHDLDDLWISEAVAPYCAHKNIFSFSFLLSDIKLCYTSIGDGEIST